MERDAVIVEVGPRDGLQNEANPVPTDRKIAFINALTAAGLPVIEATSFVNPKAVPQLADAAEVMLGITREASVRYPVLIPNLRGLERAVAASVDAIALFTAATDAFATANVGATIDETFERFAPVVSKARQRGFWIRGYVSVAFGCPYAGAVAPGTVARLSDRCWQLGCDEICLADTIGIATPALVLDVVRAVQQEVPTDRLALHFHDTSGMAVANVDAGLDLGIRIFDAAAGGLGGCPFAPGAPGNLATERLVARLDALGLRTGVSLDGVRAATRLLLDVVPRLQDDEA